jgi:hypothetical protein
MQQPLPSNVWHVASRVEEAMEAIRAFSHGAWRDTIPASQECPGVDLLVCDMNGTPSIAGELLRVVSTTARLAPDCRLVWTCKGLDMAPSAIKGTAVQAMRELSAASGMWANGMVVHLLANGHERTLLAGRLPPPEHAESQALGYSNSGPILSASALAASACADPVYAHAAAALAHMHMHAAPDP